MQEGIELCKKNYMFQNRAILRLFTTAKHCFVTDLRPDETSLANSAAAATAHQFHQILRVDR